MTTPTREQVVQLAKEAEFHVNERGIYSPYIEGSSIYYLVEKLITLARADLEDANAEQAAEIEHLSQSANNGKYFAEQNYSLRRQLAAEKVRSERLSECVKLSTEYRLGNPAYEYALTTEYASNALREYDAKLIAKLKIEREHDERHSGRSPDDISL